MNQQEQVVVSSSSSAIDIQKEDDISEVESVPSTPQQTKNQLSWSIEDMVVSAYDDQPTIPRWVEQF